MVVGIVLVIFGFFGGYLVVSSWVGSCVGVMCVDVLVLYLFVYYFGFSVVGVFGGVFYMYWDWFGVCGFVGVLIVVGVVVVWCLGCCM